MAGSDSFQPLLVVDGEGEVCCGDEKQTVQKGDSLFLPAGSGLYTVTGSLTLLRTCIPPKPVYRIGIDLGGTSIKVGIIDPNNCIAGRCERPTEANKPWEQVVSNMVDAVKGALEDADLTLADCEAVGIGSPGTIDAETGTVIYSNNFGWHDVPLAQALHDKLGLPIHISNDANCAALGEVVAGAARGCRNAILLTLGTGVGSGIILGGHIFEGGGISRQGDYLTEPLRRKVAHRVFGGEQSYLPEIRCAALENDAGMIGAANIS